MKPVRLHLSRRKGFDLKKHSLLINGLDVVNVARPSKWGNPFIVGKHGTRERCVELYKYLLSGYLCLGINNIEEQSAHHEYVSKHISELMGKNLACWCRFDGKPCHADVLLEIANGTN